MKKAAATHAPGAALLFGGLACVFIVLFGLIVTLLVSDQRSLQASVTKLRTQSLPLSIEQQRLARNLETLRLEGERVLAARTPQDRQQAMFVVNLMASGTTGTPRSMSVGWKRNSPRPLLMVISAGT